MIKNKIPKFFLVFLHLLYMMLLILMIFIWLISMIISKWG